MSVAVPAVPVAVPDVMCRAVSRCAVPLLLSTGVIINADQPADKRPRLQGAAFNGPPTRVLVLRNMVGPGEVDEDLEEEVSSSSSVLQRGRLPPALLHLLCADAAQQFVHHNSISTQLHGRLLVCMAAPAPSCCVCWWDPPAGYLFKASQGLCSTLITWKPSSSQLQQPPSTITWTLWGM